MPSFDLTAKKIHRHLEDARHVLLVPHQNPDGDSLGSALAFAHYLEDREIPTTLFCITPVAPQYEFLPKSERVSCNLSILKSINPDTVCTFDAGDMRYCGLDRILEALPKTPTIINFDHHVSNEHYGHMNLVVTDASSTTEVLHQYFDATDNRISKQIATCLLAGIVTDTGHFSNPATTPRSLEIAGKLVSRGGNFSLVLSRLHKNKAISALKLWGLALSRLTKHPEYDLAYTVITADDLEAYHVSEEEVAGIANFLNNLGEARISLVLKSTKEGMIKGSLRTTADGVDLSQLARLLGGGGHRKAAGFAVPGRIRKKENGWEIV